jgi:pimeloyl-ACP methyl ester carboxylesterase
MINLRTYGQKTFNVAVIHGGPGAPGSMAPVARELADQWGILEPLQTAFSVDGQIQELHDVLQENADTPVTLVGHSWGAMLSLLFAARYPELAKKLILVSSGCFEEQYAADIMKTRLERLNQEDNHELESLMAALDDASAQEQNLMLARLGELCTKADSYDPLTMESEILQCQYDLHISVWNEAQNLRKQRKFLEAAKKIKCPVVGFHGDYDSHPAEGVYEPLTPIIKDFQFVLFDKCGHQPWIERHAKDEFYRILREELE